RSVGLIETLCTRLRIPNAYREVAVLVARYHGQAHRVAELRPGTLLELLEKLDAFRRPPRFEQFVLACEADKRGRTGLEHQPYPQATRLREARELAASITLDAEARGTLSGEQIAERLRRVRIDALAKLQARS